MSEANCGISVKEVTEVEVRDSRGELTPRTSTVYSKELRVGTSSQRHMKTESETDIASRALRNLR